MLKIITKAKPLSKIIALKSIGDGIPGEVFETYVTDCFKHSENIGLKKVKSDIIIEGKHYQCKTATKKNSSTKIHHGTNDVGFLKTASKAEVAAYVLNRCADIKFLFLVSYEGMGYTSIANIKRTRRCLVNTEFSVKENKKSLRLDFPLGSISISAEYIYFNKKCFQTETFEEFELYEYEAKELIRRVWL